MKSSAAALILLVAGCSSAAETAYREQIECLALFDVPPEEQSSPPPGCCDAETAQLHRRAIAKRDSFRVRAIERVRALGKGPDQVTADIHAAHANLMAEVNAMGAHPAEERMEHLDDVCTRRLGT